MLCDEGKGVGRLNKRVGGGIGFGDGIDVIVVVVEHDCPVVTLKPVDEAHPDVMGIVGARLDESKIAGIVAFLSAMVELASA